MQKIHFRKISRNEEQLLEEIWEELDSQTDDLSAGRTDIMDIRDRIHSKERRRRNIVRTIYAAGAAAALGFLLWLPLRQGSEFHGKSPADRLISMGVTVSQAQVSLKMDNDISLTLTDSASLMRETGDETSVVYSSGIEAKVGNERMLRLEVPSGRQFHLRLADGTSVWLNSDSSLEYPASFDGHDTRTVKLSGEAFFDVARNERCPFIVELENGEKIKVLGTSFNVNAYPDNENNVTTLISGMISYTQPDSGSDHILHPDQQISVDKTSGTAAISKVETESAVSWKGHIISFEDEKLPVLARRLSRMYGIEIIVGEHLHDQSFSGRISYDKGVEFITELIEETSGIVCEVRNGKIILN